MAWVDWLLNLSCLLLGVGAWLGRSQWCRQLVVAKLAGTLRVVETPWIRPCVLVGGMFGLLLVRAWWAWCAGNWSVWTPQVDLGVLRVSFPPTPGWPGLTLASVYAGLSFAALAVGFWFWMLLLSSLGRGLLEHNALYPLIQRCALLPLRWSFGARLGLAWALIGLAWMGVEPWMAKLGLVPEPLPWPWRGWQAGILSLGACLSWKPLLVAVLLAYWVNLYIYMGSHPLWDLVARVGRRLTMPLRKLPCRFMRLDLVPPCMAGCFWGLAWVLEHGVDLPRMARRLPGLTELYHWCAR
ncbi:MAG: hypothetical protein RMN51_00715 [Verrucomicrobiota bacterium]|nr:hypothetical protein [Limisphaera sp.]MDW8380622.1 hypothetical protein [Verrucomicrobiota bacterium]